MVPIIERFRGTRIHSQETNRSWVRIRLRGKTINTVALTNTGFETETPQPPVPRRLLIANNIEEIPWQARRDQYGAAEGPVVLHISLHMLSNS